MTYRLATPIAIAAAMIATAVLGASIRAQGGAARPDVIILLTDQQRADAFGAAGAQDVHTPSMDRLAREGVMFSRVRRDAAVLSVESRNAHGALSAPDWRDGEQRWRRARRGHSCNCSSPGGHVTRAGSVVRDARERVRHCGIRYGHFGKWHLGGTPGDYGFETHDPGSTTRRLRPGSGASCRRAPRLARASPCCWSFPGSTLTTFTAFSRRNPPTRDVSRPRGFPQTSSTRSSRSRFAAPLSGSRPRPFVGADETVWRRYRAFYNGLIETVDREIGLVLEALPRRDLAPITVFSSDHGDLGGAHGLPHKGPVMDEELLRVPLAIAWPGRIRSARSDALVSLIDLLPTLCDLTGVKAPSGVDGLTLRPILELPHRAVRPGRAIWSSAYTTASRPGASRSGWSGRSAGNTRDTRDTATSVRPQKDPGELRNLAREPSAASSGRASRASLTTGFAAPTIRFPHSRLRIARAVSLTSTGEIYRCSLFVVRCSLFVVRCSSFAYRTRVRQSSSLRRITVR